VDVLSVLDATKLFQREIDLPKREHQPGGNKQHSQVQHEKRKIKRNPVSLDAQQSERATCEEQSPGQPADIGYVVVEGDCQSQ
jgi:hypothetical protein